ncbi:MAG: hypothetical protein KUG78_08975 [Kangiellaceae bacterium]|nr:hypothetical protein [Kangiellaceae bacterium]
MASSLTSTSSKSGNLYLFLLIFVVIGLFYLFFIKRPTATIDFQRQAFRLNSSAFENGIRLANMRFKSSSIEQNLVDRWFDKDVGLDYNENGFPIGTDIVIGESDKGMSAENCQQVWRFVLGPLQPKMLVARSENEYWVEVDANNNCVFHPFKIQQMQLSYHSTTGKVVLTK